MAQIIIKKSSVANKVPLVTDLAYGELALNYQDGKLYYKKSDGTTVDHFPSAPVIAAGYVAKTGDTLTGNLTLNAGTGNGIAYLNGSKVLTSGSALTFDGTDFATTGSVLLNNAQYYYGKNTAGGFVRLLGVTAGNVALIGPVDAGPADVMFSAATTVTNQQWFIGGTERMRLTSTGLGIGTSSPGSKLAVNGSITESTDGINYHNVVTQQDIGTAPNEIPLNQYLGSLAYQNADSARVVDLRVDGNLTVVGSQTLAGSVGLGDAAGDTLTINAGTTTLTEGTANGVLYLNASKQLTSGTGLRYTPTVSQSTLVVEGVNSTLKLNSTNGVYPSLMFENSGVNKGIIGIDGSSLYSYVATGNLYWSIGSEQMRLTSTGLGIGTSTPGTKLDVAGTIRSTRPENSGYYSEFKTNLNDVTTLQINVQGNTVFQAGATNDLNIYALGANNLKLYTNNAERMRVDATGNLGIGTTSPAYRLDVSALAGFIARLGTASASALFYGAGGEFGMQAAADGANVFTLNSTAGYAGIGAKSYIPFTVNGTERARFDVSGNLGIGTSSPGNTKLVVQTNTGTETVLVNQTDNTGATLARLRLTHGSGTNGLFEVGNGFAVLGTASTSPLVFTTANSERMRLDAAGNLGIGISSPLAKLDISGTGVQTVRIRDTSATGYSGLTLGTSGTQAYAIGVGGGSETAFSVANKFFVYDSLAGAMRIALDTSGNLGIGSVSPNAKLDVNGNIRVSNINVGATNTSLSIGTYASSSSTAYGTNLRAYHNFGLGGASDLAFEINGTTEVMRITSNSNVGIGTSSPGVKLDVVGQQRLTRTTSSSSALVQYTDTGAANNSYFSLYNASDAWLYATSKNGTGVIKPIRFATNDYGNSTTGVALAIETNGNVGVGTSSPVSVLTVQRGAVVGVGIALNLNNPYTYGTGVGTAAVGIRFNRSPNDAGTTGVMADIYGGNSSETTSTGGFLAFATRTGASEVTTERMRIDSVGNVGIGTTSIGDFGSTTVTVEAFKSGGALYRARGTNVDAIMQASDGSSSLLFGTRSAHSINFQTNNAERMRLDSSGNLGIGTSAPNTRAEVSGTEAYVSLRVNTQNAGISSSNYSEVQLSDNGAVRAYWRNVRDGSGQTQFAYNSFLAFLADAGGTPTERVRITSAGNVGIGTVSPFAKLTVAGGASFSSDVTVTGGSIQARSGINLYLWDTTTTNYYYINNPGGSATNAAVLSFVQNGTGERMRLDASGNLGIGTTTPSAKLQVSSSAYAAHFGEGSGGAGLDIKNRLATLPTTGTVATIGWLESNSGFSAGSLLLGSRPTVGNVILSATGAADVVVSPTLGNVGIGTIAPTQKLEVYTGAGFVTASTNDGAGSSGGFGYQLRIANTDHVIGQLAGVYTNSGSNGSGGVAILTRSAGALIERLRITDVGSVGIGTSSPSSRFHVEGASVAANIIASSGSGVIRLADSPAGANRKELTMILNTTNNRVEFQAVHQGVVTMPITFNAGGGNVGIGVATPQARLQVEELGVDTTTTTIAIAAGQTAVYSVATTAFRTLELMAQVTQGSSYHSVKLFALHNGTDVWFNQTNVLHTGAELGTFNMDISGGNVRLLYTPTSTATTSTIKVGAIKLAV